MNHATTLIDEQISALQAELNGLRTPEPTAAEARLRDLKEDLAFEKAKKKYAKDNVGRLRVEPGQLVFRQLYKLEIDRQAVAEEGPATTMVNEMNIKAALLEPSWEEYQEWCHRYPFLPGEYTTALSGHMRATRREREGK